MNQVILDHCPSGPIDPTYNTRSLFGLISLFGKYPNFIYQGEDDIISNQSRYYVSDFNDMFDDLYSKDYTTTINEKMVGISFDVVADTGHIHTINKFDENGILRKQIISEYWTPKIVSITEFDEEGNII